VKTLNGLAETPFSVHANRLNSLDILSKLSIQKPVANSQQTTDNRQQTNSQIANPTANKQV
jgi:hypothetical protein